MILIGIVRLEQLRLAVIQRLLMTRNLGNALELLEIFGGLNGGLTIGGRMMAATHWL